MTTLGEAYIAVKADMRPFTRDLKKEVEAVVKDTEGNVKKGLSQSLAQGAKEAGGKASEEFANEFEEKNKRRFGKKNEKKPWMVQIASSLASALDDGISALPMHVKAAIAGGILLVLPLISGALAGAVAAGIGAGFAGLGVLLAFQYDVVRQKATQTFGDLRVRLADLAAPFVAETLRGLDQISAAFADWGPLLDRIFIRSSKFVEPLTRGTLGAFNNILVSIAKISGKLDPFVMELSKGFEIIGAAVGQFLEMLVNTGEDGQKALRDLIVMVADLILILGELIVIFTEVYGFVRKIAEAVPYLTSLLGFFVASVDQGVESTDLFGQSLDDLTYYQDGNVVATQKQITAMKQLVQAMNDAYNAAFDLIDAEIGYEEAVDRLTESLQQNGNTFNIKTKEGRDNLRAFEAALKAIHEQVMGLLEQGNITAEQAKQMQDNLTEALYKQAGAAGANTTALHQMFDEAMAFGDIPVGNQAWLDQIQAKAMAAARAIAEAKAQADALNHAGLGAPGFGRGTRGFSEFAEGGIVDGPTPAIVGEAGPEVIIPLSKPGRAAQLADQSGLASMLGMGASAPIVYVFLGNDQLEPYMVQVVNRNNKAMGTAMAFGARGL